ncbi:MAG: UvrD-helicase domain-containing protein [Clostridia bacterium]|nr:UvrD-helicase domain-containing protein [Clostridia bacterium]
MEWTTNQQLAIDAEGADILVAAGAGSGKTAVLVRRIIREVMERPEPYNVDDLLVLTYTKAAAEEMRSRLYQRMDDVLEQAKDEATVKRVYDQQVRLRRASIGTIDSFCKNLISENVRESGIDESWSVCDKAQQTVLLEEAAARACEKFSASDPDRYKNLMDVYGTIFRDAGVAEAVTGIVKGALTAVYPEEWIDKCEAEYTSFGADESDDFAETPCGKWLLGFLRLKLLALLSEFRQLRAMAEPIAPYAESLDKDVSMLTAVTAAFNADKLSWADAFSKCCSIAFEKLKKYTDKKNAGPEAVAISEQVKDRRNLLKEEVKGIKTKFFSEDPASPRRDRDETVGGVRALCEMAREAYAQFRSIKAEQRLYDYGDMERKALEILTDATVAHRPSELALSYRKRFAEVYVDEYQDTNELQERILDAICGTPGDRGPEAPFRFMVGDVKQSIYGFRGGCPDLFMQKYMSYPTVRSLPDIQAAIDARSPGVRILLGENFRSRREIIDSVNAVFDSVMNEETAGMPYGEPEHLIYGAQKAYDASSGDPAKPRESRYRTEVVVVESRGLTADDQTVLEAHEIGGRIMRMVNEGFPIVGKDGALRPVNYSDFTILIRDIKKAGSVFADHLRGMGVPVRDTESRYGLFKYPEVRVLTSFLKILDNPLDDIPLFAVLTNIYGLEADMLTRISRTEVPGGRRTGEAACVDGSDGGDDKDEERGDGGDEDGQRHSFSDAPYLYDRLRYFSENFIDDEDASLREYAELTAAFLERLNVLRTLTGRRPAAETVWECMNENGFADALHAAEGGSVGYGNLMRLMKLASGFDKSGRGGYCDFVRLINMYEADGSNDIGAESPEGNVSDAVSISTIHKSKGLDYQIVFIAQTHKGSDKKEEKSKLLTHKKLGLGPMRLDMKERRRVSTAMRATIKLRAKAESHAEELRVLYVAMTRAHEKMVITGVVNDRRKFVDECAFALDPDTELPTNYNVIKTDNYLKHVCLAALGKHRENIAILKDEYIEDLRNELLARKSGAAGDKQYDDTLPFRFCLPRVPRWDPDAVSGTGAAPARTPPVKISVSEVKRLSNAALAGAEEDAGTTAPALEQLTARQRPELKPLDGEQASAKDAKQAATAGTLLHCCLEHIDFAEAAAAGAESVAAAGAYAEKLIAGLTARGFIPEEDAKLISRPMLTAFIRSDFAKELSRADYLKREIPFTFNCDAGKLLNDPDYAGQQTAVQGVIDCVYRAGGKLVLADYKSDHVRGGDHRAHSERYLTQLSIYAEACRRRFGALPDRIVLYYLRDGEACEIPAAELKRL